MRSRPLPTGTRPTQALDLYDPRPDGPGRAADAGRLAVLFVHGGGWYAGARDAYAGWADHAAGRGHPAGSVGYRTDPESTYRDKRDDVLAGWRLLGEEFPDADRVCLVGSSAGAHLVTMLGLERPPPGVLPAAAVVSMNGPGSMRPQNLLQSQERLTQLGLTADEIDRLDLPVESPPLDWLFLHAEHETYFPHVHVAAMADRLAAAGHRTETVVVPGTEHGFGYQVLAGDTDQRRISAAAVEGLWDRVSGR